MVFNIDLIIENNVPVHLRNSNIIGFIKSFVNNFIKINDDIDKLKKSIFIDTAKGNELDDIARIFLLFRLEGENDVSFRSRIKSFYQVALASGTIDGIKKAISLLLNVSIDNIDITQILEYNQQQLVADMETDESWSVGTAEPYIRYNGTQSLKLDTVGASYINTTLNKNINLDINGNNENDMFKFWLYIEDLSAVNTIFVTFSDGINSAAIEFDANINSILVEGAQFIEFKKSDLTVYGDDIDWANITIIDLACMFGNTGAVYFDYMTMGMYGRNNKFNITIAIDENTELNALENILTVINNAKAAGVYYGGLYNGTYYGQELFKSSDEVFRYNLSNYNSDDKLL